MLLSSEEKRKKGQSNVEEALSFLFFVDGCWFSPCELLSLMTRSTLIHKDWKIASVQRRPSSFLNDVTLDVTSRFGRMAECFRVSNVTFVWAVFFFSFPPLCLCFSVSDLRRFCFVDISFVCDHECF